MYVVAIAGSGSGSGKTTLALAVLTLFPWLVPIKFSPRENSEEISITVSRPQDQGNHDSNKMAKIAGLCYYVTGKRDMFTSAFSTIKKREISAKGFLIEGNAASLLVRNDLLLFSNGSREWKEGSAILADKAQMVFNNLGALGIKDLSASSYLLLADGTIENIAREYLSNHANTFLQS